MFVAEFVQSVNVTQSYPGQDVWSEYILSPTQRMTTKQLTEEFQRAQQA